MVGFDEKRFSVPSYAPSVTITEVLNNTQEYMSEAEHTTEVLIDFTDWLETQHDADRLRTEVHSLADCMMRMIEEFTDLCSLLGFETIWHKRSTTSDGEEDEESFES